VDERHGELHHNVTSKGVASLNTLAPHSRLFGLRHGIQLNIGLCFHKRKEAGWDFGERPFPFFSIMVFASSFEQLQRYRWMTLFSYISLLTIVTTCT
jgi:hypothetical protein